MSDCQFIASNVSVDLYSVNRQTDIGAGYSAEMAKTARDRSPFGARLVQARDHAGLNQREVAKRVGMGQGTLSQAEVSGEGSTYTAQIAKVCGVSAAWLADNIGGMLDGVTAAREADLRLALLDVATSLAVDDQFARKWPRVSEWFSRLADESIDLETFNTEISRLLPGASREQLQPDNEVGRTTPTGSGWSGALGPDLAALEPNVQNPSVPGKGSPPK